MPLELAFDFTIEVLKLGIAIRVVRSLQRLAVGLQTVSQIVEHPAHQLVTGLMPHLPQFLRQLPQALTGPTQWRFRIAASNRLHQPFQIPH